MPERHHMQDVVIVGAGLAGLRAAALLARGGRDVVVVEAGDDVGGRQRTDAVDGFLLDRGFQVVNPRYDALARAVDVAAVDLRPFPVGVRVVRGGTDAVLAHPVRHPELLGRTLAALASDLVPARDVVAAARWVLPALLRPGAVAAAPDATLHAAWHRVGLAGSLRTAVLEPFLAGVLADDTAVSSAAYAALLVRLFALGRPGVPAEGIGALPRRLARIARSAGAEIRLAHRVTAVRAHGDRVEVEVAGADALTARAVVVATGPEHVAELTPLPAPARRGLQTWWFAGEEPPASALLTVDGDRRGPIVNSVAMSLTAPGYAPAGRHLVAATCLLPAAARHDPDAGPREREVRAQLTRLWGSGTAAWTLLRRDDLPDALPALGPPMRHPSPVQLGDRLFVAGDHRETPSIAGALVSGERVARAILDDGAGTGGAGADSAALAREGDG